ncbi:adenylate cyclase, partial [Globisporangium polare]
MNDCYSMNQGFLPSFSTLAQAPVAVSPWVPSPGNKGALSFILSSSSSSSSSDSEFQAAVVPTPLVKRKR